MKAKVKFLIVLLSLSITLSLTSNTYSRYVADTTGNLEVSFTNWQILVNETDITSNANSSITLTPIIEENSNIAKNKIAPTSTGYFDIDIDPSNVELSFDYAITLAVENENIPDLMITKYALLNSTDTEEDALEVTNIDGNVIEGSLQYDNSVDDFNFEPFIIRIYFEWYEGIDETMDDEADSLIGTNAQNETLRINANIEFSQKIN